MLFQTLYAVFAISKNNGKSTPFGFGAQTTGGGSAPEQTPSSLEELASWLKDDRPRTIIIDRMFDFTDTQGNKTENGCAPWTECPDKNKGEVQHARNVNDWCEPHIKAGKSISVTFRVAATEPLEIGNDKTIKGVGTKGVIKGKGLCVSNKKNIIIQNIHITDCNAHLVWGGDAIQIRGGENIWVDHCTFSYIGRMMFAMGSGKNIGITLSNNHFQGKTRWSTNCSNRHYWSILVLGPEETVTMANNCLDHTSGRSPKLGGSDKDKVTVHYYNNIHIQCQGQGIDAGKGSKMLAEGNLFKQSHPVNPSDVLTEGGGESYFPFTEAELAACQSVFGRACVANQVLNSGKCQNKKDYQFGKKSNVPGEFKSFDSVIKADVRPTSDLIQSGPPGGCGIGHI
ncbi:hypothetical protein CROQUDRAFT_53916 [Cronartium quercuum f. sp. fusiforme G11]|uniref:pectin lyase n=1 Tax=Cronartium quercuum f. sp. fusiforme G11 TaxID=708437 RepID=A0A9P6N934_9BASI|nr:hypothetical protein CROQUDRAFT_53916 [Cronartium quercuum f. sp. fusiforme G11]